MAGPSASHDVARARRYLAQVVQDPGDVRGLGYSLYLRTFGLDERAYACASGEFVEEGMADGGGQPVSGGSGWSG
jgi:hypothetical protein